MTKKQFEACEQQDAMKSHECLRAKNLSRLCVAVRDDTEQKYVARSAYVGSV